MDRGRRNEEEEIERGETEPGAIEEGTQVRHLGWGFIDQIELPENLDPAFPTNPTDLPAACAVLVNVITSETSSYRFRLFLPITTCNECYLTVDDGGFSGVINWLDVGAGVRYGFAVASTDMGHNSTMTNITWALGQPEKQLDFGFRATHGTIVIVKRPTETFDASKIKYPYYSGCSTGGRQGLKDAQLFPDDFDGLLIGAPG
ncbi:putative feruloyl esterase b protein [Botrytis fragariae]|uniref:Carboxylic ester hydrolase n=1 Tax=Botrytis fragariae TaxID=1964551 RepID=A0A8H6AW26_9HELO|nr:putative feruloyl esterase b protein [Botrytis fragariae]KAF5874781.1 putative feruloyl esterase b protein [Botrytis fragariae]